MRRLYLQVYLSFVGILCLFAVLVMLAWRLVPAGEEDERMLDGLGALAAELLPPDRPRSEQEAVLRRLASPLHIQLTLWSPQGVPLAEVGRRLPFPGATRTRGGWMGAHGGPLGALRLPDGRWLVARHHARPPFGHGAALLLAVTMLAMAVAVGAYPLARRLTRRIERLRAGVEELGSGDLRARVPVEGKDEVAALARSFNLAVDRIEALLGAQRALLASASHELRTPLTRIRVALELLGAGQPEQRARVERDITELDELIAELLLASRLQSVEQLDRVEEVDLLGLAAEEAARCEAEATGQPAHVRGDPRLLRRLVRNLLENARRHGGGSAVEAHVATSDGRVHLTVCDRGPGVPAAESERIFDPFYRAAGAASGEGAGLGLALVRQIARRHGGDARYRARDGGGSCFEVDLPAHESARPVLS
jgi:signal transduction histidine kinase